ncbi:unnamed protein product [Diatraea saccharalis]|uniref:RNF34/RFFL SAP domain-containing protein n=1 Tax=Diatraea saccharalis TaxID=40085 RepID=A0A9N9W8V6_9NEOP|nr:unnamed protein product [Diatraea saccharalis]
MLTRGRRSKMPCESCAVQFSVFKRKQVCYECERYYCSGCLRREGSFVLCVPCKVLSTRPLLRQSIAHLKVRDLQCFLQRQNVSTRGCVEKEELVSLCLSHVNSSTYRRRGPRARPSPFSSLKGFTNNLNVFINNAFEMRNNAQPAPPPPPPQHSNCHNASHVHTQRPPPGHRTQPAPHPPRERFTTTPGGERDITVPVPSRESPDEGEAQAQARAHPHVDTDDCYEIEDLDDAGWEFVTRPAAALPNDSEVLIAESDTPERSRPPPAESAQPDESPPRRARLEVPAAAGGAGGAGPLGPQQRAASEAELRPRGAAPEPDSLSLHDEPLPDSGTGGGRGAGEPGAGDVGVAAGGAERARAEAAAGAQPRGVPRLPRAGRPARPRQDALQGPRALQTRDGVAAAGGVLQDLHGGAAGVRAAGVRAHRGVHGVQQRAGRVPHLPPVRRARRAMLPRLTAPSLVMLRR